MLHFHHELYFCVFYTNTRNIMSFNQFQATSLFLYYVSRGHRKKQVVLNRMISQQHYFNCIGALCDLVPFAPFKKREKHLWRSVTFSKVAGFNLKPATLLKVTFLKRCFIHFKFFIYCTNVKHQIKSFIAALYSFIYS